MGATRDGTPAPKLFQVVRARLLPALVVANTLVAVTAVLWLLLSHHSWTTSTVEKSAKTAALLLEARAPATVQALSTMLASVVADVQTMRSFAEDVYQGRRSVLQQRDSYYSSVRVEGTLVTDSVFIKNPLYVRQWDNEQSSSVFLPNCEATTPCTGIGVQVPRFLSLPEQPAG